MLLKEFTALFPMLLLAASLLAFFAHYLSPGEGYELIGIALAVVVILNALVSFYQNHKVEKLMLSFLDFIPKQVALLRNGEKVVLDANEVVPGDILLLQEGDKIPADGVILEMNQLLVDESILTGESEPLNKSALDAVVDETCLVSSGATVLKGNAIILITRTGRDTSLGSISRLSQEVKNDLTPMQEEIQNFVRKITWLALGIGISFFILGFFIGNPFWTNLVFAIGIIVANVPEGLLPTVTLALTQSSLRMGKCNAVVKNILSVETLGSTTVICTDKTGTLTRNQLHVEKAYLDFTEVDAENAEGFKNNRAARTFLEIIALCNDVISVNHNGNHGQDKFKGDPTETAMATYADKLAGFDALRSTFELKHNRPFDSDNKYMSSTHATQGGTLFMTVKGAPNKIISLCTQVHSEGLVRALRDDEREHLIQQANHYAGQGLRLLALAYRVVEQADAEAEELVFVGLVAMVDPPRREVPAAVAACKSAGIRIIVISGDKAETVNYIARKLGIVSNPRVIEGPELAAMSPENLCSALTKEVVFARIAPEQKLIIVESLKSMGEVVAVTGDGVNDAPALKRADIGVSMGLHGTDVAKEASDIILLDDNFATIIKAIEEGRTVYDNIKKFITYILTSNIPEILPFIAYVLLPIPLPITVIQILAIDLITDMIPAIGLGNEPPEADTMQRPPRSRNERLVSFRTFVRSYAIVGPAEAALAFAAFFVVLSSGGWSWGEALPKDAALHLQASGAFLARAPMFECADVLVDVAASCGEVTPMPDTMSQIHCALVLGVRDYVRRNGCSQVLIGLSGGIDSALVAALAVEALGAEQVLGVLMPSRYSSDHSISDAEALVANLGIESIMLPIESPVAAVDALLAESFAMWGLSAADVTEENVQARIRGLLLMAVSNKTGRMLLTTGNKSEMAVGYATLYGDMAGGFAPLKDVYKTQAFALARHINRHAVLIPESTISKPPSAELRPDQMDSDSLPDYAVLDEILQSYIELGQDMAHIAARGFESGLVERVIRMLYIAEYKRRQAPPGVKITQKAFGRDRRYPITHGFREHLA